jgi:hypothetical protein
MTDSLARGHLGGRREVRGQHRRLRALQRERRPAGRLPWAAAAAAPRAVNVWPGKRPSMARLTGVFR